MISTLFYFNYKKDSALGSLIYRFLILSEIKYSNLTYINLIIKQIEFLHKK